MVHFALAFIGAADPVTIDVIVADRSGKPIVGAVVAMRTITNFETGRNEIPRGGFAEYPLPTDNRRTDAYGRWKSPPLKAGAGYVVEASAPGFVGDYSRWVHPLERGTVKLPAIVLRRVVTIAGEVKDRTGKPLGGVRVFANGDGPKLCECTSQPDGKFALPGVPEGPLFVFAEKPGYYFTGKLHDSAHPPTLVLAPRSAPNPERFPPLPPAPPAKPDPQAAEARRKKLVEAAQRVFAQPKDEGKFRAANMLSFTDPAATLRMIRTGNFSERLTSDQCIQVTAYGLTTWDIEESKIALAEISTAGTRNIGWLHIQNKVKDSSARHRAFARRVLEIRDDENAENRAYALVLLADDMAKAGFRQEAASLASEAEDLARSFRDSPGSQNLWFMLCMTWCELDVNRAKALLPKASKNAYERVAERMAKHDPALAERLHEDYTKTAGTTPTGHWHDDLCYELAQRDLPRAERVADKTLKRTDLFEGLADPSAPAPAAFDAPSAKPIANDGPAMKRAVIQAFLADARIEVGDRNGAKRSLKDAVERIRKAERAALFVRSGFYYDRSVCLAVLLPLAERIDENAVAELFWMSLAYRLPVDSSDSYEQAGCDVMRAGTAAMLARYSHEAAKSILAGVGERGVRTSWRGAGNWAVFSALNRVDPSASGTYAQRYCDLVVQYAANERRQSPREIALERMSISRSDASARTKPSLLAWRMLLGWLWMEGVVDRDVLEEDS